MCMGWDRQFFKEPLLFFSSSSILLVGVSKNSFALQMIPWFELRQWLWIGPRCQCRCWLPPQSPLAMLACGPGRALSSCFWRLSWVWEFGIIPLFYNFERVPMRFLDDFKLSGTFQKEGWSSSVNCVVLSSGLVLVWKERFLVLYMYLSAFHSEKYAKSLGSWDWLIVLTGSHPMNMCGCMKEFNVNCKFESRNCTLFYDHTCRQGPCWKLRRCAHNRKASLSWLVQKIWAWPKDQDVCSLRNLLLPQQPLCQGTISLPFVETSVYWSWYMGSCEW
jgi:hypothetical protein